LLAGEVTSDQVQYLTRTFSTVRFERMGRDGPVPATAAGSSVLFTFGQSGAAFNETLAALPNLVWVHTASSGVDRLAPHLRGTSLTLTRTAEARAEQMAEHVLAMTLALVKRLPETLDRQNRREWRRCDPGTLAGATIGFVGAGSVGRAAATMFKAFNTRTIGLRRSPGVVPGFDEVIESGCLDALLKASDVLVVACPLTEETRGLLGADAFQSMRQGALLINVARGGIVIETALIRSLESGHLAGAALDVFEVEPLPESSPLWSMSNVIVTPHSSSAGPGVKDAVLAEFTANLVRFMNCEPLSNVVDLESRDY